MALGACLLVDLLLRFRQIDHFYTDNGVLPREALLLYRAPVLSLHMANGAWPFQAGLLLISMVAAVGLIAGYRTRLVTVVSWVALLSLQARNPLAAHAGDRLLKALLFWGMFLPLNGRWSVDDKRQDLPASHLSAAGVALILQICALYWFAAAEKMTPVWLTERSAVYYALNIDLFATPAAVALRDHAALTRLLTLGTMFTELIGPFLAIAPILPVPLRLSAVLLFVGMHIGMGLTLHLGTFPWICAAAWLSLMPGAVWDRLKWPGTWRLRTLQGTSPRPIPVWAQSIALCWLWFIALGLVTSAPEPGPNSTGLHRVLWQAGAIQRWAMFAPIPTPYDGWPVFEGVREDGNRVDVWRGGRPTHDRPEDMGTAYRDARWLGYLLAISGHEGEPYRQYFARYLCREGRVRSLSLAFMAEHTPPPGAPTEVPKRQTLWEGDCP